MLRSEFNAIIEDIERHMEGDGYFITATMKSGRSFEGGWCWLDRTTARTEIVVLSDNRNPPFYVPLSSIESIHLSPR